MNKNLLLIAMLFGLSGLFGQTYELQYSNRPTAAPTTGPIVYTTHPWTFLPTTLSGDVTVFGTYSDFQYSPATDTATNYGENSLMFGATSNDYPGGKYVLGTQVYANLGFVGAPKNSYFSAGPNQIGAGIIAEGFPPGQNGAFIQYTSVEGIARLNGVDVLDNQEFNMGKVTYTFNQPVDNPIIHISGLGGQSITGTTSDDAAYLWFSTELELTSPYTLQYLSGTYYPPGMSTRVFDVNTAENKIINSFADGYEPLPYEDGASGDMAGSGSAMIVGENITEVTFNVWMRAKSDGRWTQDDMYAGDLYAVSFSFNESICTVAPTGDPQPTYVGISTLDRNVNEWLADDNPDGQENLLSAYIALESTNKAFVITRNADPDNNIANPVEGMVVWDTTENCLKLYIVDDTGGYWSCVSQGCNQ